LFLIERLLVSASGTDGFTGKLQTNIPPKVVKKGEARKGEGHKVLLCAQEGSSGNLKSRREQTGKGIVNSRTGTRKRN